MRTRHIVVAATALAIPLTAQAAGQDFVLINRTGYQIDAIYVTELGNQAWGNDLLATDKLKADERINIAFDRKTQQCHWSLRVRYHDATQATWSDLDLCRLSQVSLLWDVQSNTTIIRSE